METAPATAPLTRSRRAGGFWRCSASASCSWSWTTRSSTSRCRRSAATCTPRPRPCSGSSTGTPFPSPGCCCSAATSATASAGGGSCNSGWCSSALFSVGAALSRSTGELIAARAADGLRGGARLPGHAGDPEQRVHRRRASARSRSASGPRSPGSPSRSARCPAARCCGTSPGPRCSTCRCPVAVLAVVARPASCCRSRVTRAPGGSTPSARLLSVAGITLLTWSIIEAPQHGWGSFATVGGIGGSLAILGGFAWWQARRPDPMLDVRLFRNPRFARGERGDRAVVLRPVRVHLHDHPVLPGRPRLRPAGRRARDAAVRVRHRRVLAGRDAAHAADRHQARGRGRAPADERRVRWSRRPPR